MPLKNPRQTKASATAAKKEDIAQKVKEIKMRQKNWMQQREEHISSTPSGIKQASGSGSDHGHQIKRESETEAGPRASSSQTHDILKPQPVMNDKPNEQSAVSDKLNVQVKHGFNNWLQSRKEPPEEGSSRENTKSHSQDKLEKTSLSAENVIPKEKAKPSVETENRSVAAEEFFDAREGDSLKKPHHSHRSLPLSASEFDSLADSIVSRVKKDLGINIGSVMYSTRAGNQDNVSRGQTFVQETGRVLDSQVIPSVSESMESHIDLSSHKCPFCSTLMLMGKNLPTLVVPCGHTMCKQCAGSHTTCRLCGTRVVSLTTNIMLQQIIQEFHRKASHHRGGDTPGKSMNANVRSQTRTTSANVSYSAQLRNFMEREAALTEEMKSVRKDRDEAVSLAKRAQRQLENIQREEQTLMEQQQQLEEKLRMLQEHKEEYAGECQRLQEQQKTAEDRTALVERTLKSLGEEIDKVRFLAEAQGEALPDKRVRQDISS